MQVHLAAAAQNTFRILIRAITNKSTTPLARLTTVTVRQRVCQTTGAKRVTRIRIKNFLFNPF